jgi:hypothetical protein
MTVQGKNGTTHHTRSTRWTTERWSATSPLRSHVIIDEAGGERSETEITGREYRANAGRYVHVTAIPKDALPSLALLQAGAGSLLIQGTPAQAARGEDPVDQIRRLLSSHAVHEAGTRMLRGRAVLRLAATPRTSPDAIPAPEYLVDANTFEPVQITSSFGYSPAPGVPMQTLATTTTFRTYEHLAETPDHLASLRIDLTGKTIIKDPEMFRGVVENMR